jgi:hypothetical protein
MGRVIATTEGEWKGQEGGVGSTAVDLKEKKKSIKKKLGVEGDGLGEEERS